MNEMRFKTSSFFHVSSI